MYIFDLEFRSKVANPDQFFSFSVLVKENIQIQRQKENNFEKMNGIQFPIPEAIHLDSKENIEYVYRTVNLEKTEKGPNYKASFNDGTTTISLKTSTDNSSPEEKEIEKEKEKKKITALDVSSVGALLSEEQKKIMGDTVKKSTTILTKASNSVDSARIYFVSNFIRGDEEITITAVLIQDEEMQNTVEELTTRHVQAEDFKKLSQLLPPKDNSAYMAKCTYPRNPIFGTFESRIFVTIDTDPDAGDLSYSLQIGSSEEFLLEKDEEFRGIFKPNSAHIIGDLMGPKLNTVDLKLIKTNSGDLKIFSTSSRLDLDVQNRKPHVVCLIKASDIPATVNKPAETKSAGSIQSI